jgi:anaerobic ribonucleoside-triphosphate reductase activating protein
MGWDEIVRLSQMNAGSEKGLLNVAALSSATRYLGPGVRAAVWVQGCTIQCPGCIAPDWIPVKPAHLVDPELLAVELLKNPMVTGLTLSGGEPMLQASALARLVRKARQMRDLDVICFSGFRLSYLLKNPPDPGVDALLQTLDVLIDGPYLDQKNDNLGLRGSSNQQIHFISDRLKGTEFHLHQRSVEIEVSDGQAFMVGIPTRTLHHAFSRAVEQSRHQPVRMVSHERA